MTVQLDPRIAEKIREFSQRRRRLILIRGLCALFTIGIIALTAVAFVDYLVFLADSVRYLLSFAAYMATIVVLYFTTIRYLSHRANMRELAQLFESVSPELREHLLSAVELADPKNKRELDSSEFRQMLQNDVAGRVSELKIDSILPTRLVVRWLGALGIVAMVMLVFALIPQLQFGKLILRAAVPIANIERVSDVEIKVIEPSPADGLIPQGDSVSMIVEVSDEDIEEVYLESIPDDGSRNQVVMNPVGHNRFSATINVGRHALKYRVRAGNGQTRYYTLRMFPRPQALSFAKTYTYPVYSKLPQQTDTSTDGNIKALQGSSVDLVIKADQSVKEAYIHLDSPKGKRQIPLEIDNGKELHASLKIDESATYKVHLVSAETGFDNKFSPRYEIQAQADSGPSISFVKPKTDISVPRGETVDIRGQAKDNLAVKSVKLSYRVNGAPPVLVDILKDSDKKEFEFDYKFDLDKLKLRPGDEVLMALTCTDLKGSLGSSEAHRVTITSVGFDANRMDGIKRWYSVRRRIRGLEKSSQMARKQSDANGLSQIQQADTRQQKILALSASTQRAAETADSVHSQIKSVLPLMKKSRESDDLVLSSRVASMIRHQSFEAATSRLQNAQELPREEQLQDVNYVKQLINTGSGNSAKFARLFDALLCEQEALMVRKDMLRLLTEQQQTRKMAEKGSNPEKVMLRVPRRQRVIYENIKELSVLIKHLEKRTTERGDIRNVANSLAQIGKLVAKELNDGGRVEYGHFKGEYFADRDLKQLKHTRQDHQINFHWGGEPAPGLPRDGFSVRWTGTIVPTKDGVHTFKANVDDGCRLWVDDKLIIDQWTDGPKQDIKATIELEKGKAYPLKFEFMENTSEAVARLSWATQDQHFANVSAVKKVHFNLSHIENQLNHALSNSERTLAGMQRRAVQARRELAAMLGSPAREIAEASQALKEQKKAAESGDKKAAEQARKKAEEKMTAAVEQLKDRADAEEMRKDLDPRFVNDTAKTAEALEAIKERLPTPENQEKAVKAVAEIEKAYQALETDHAVRKAEEELAKLESKERWDKDSKEKAKETSEAWEQVKEDLANAQKNAAESSEAQQETAKQLAEAMNSKDAKAIEKEMDHRERKGEEKKDLTGALEEMRDKIAKESSKLAEVAEQARKSIEEQTPKLSDKLADLAKEADAAEKKSQELADKAAEKTMEDVHKEAAELQKQQEELNDRIQDIRKDLRRDANAQDLATEEGRERARDADDALAMLRKPPEEAEDKLDKAVAAQDQEEQKQALDDANREQEKTKEALDLLAKHYENAEKGKPEETRQALREKEKELGVEEKLDEQYAALEALNDLDADAIDKKIKELEKQLAKDKDMQEELKKIAEQTAKDANEKLKDAAKQEENIAATTEKVEKQQQSQDQKNEKALKEFADKIRDMADKELPNLQKQAKADQKEQLKQAEQEMDKAAKDLPRNIEQLSEALKKLEKTAEKLEQAEKQLEKLENDAAKAEQAAKGELGQEQKKAKAEAQEAKQAEKKAAAAEKAAQEAKNNVQKLEKQLTDSKQKAEQAKQKADQAKAEAQQEKNAAEAAAKNAEQAKNDAKQAAEKAQQAKQAAEKLMQQLKAGKASKEDAQQAAKKAQQAEEQAKQAGKNSEEKAQQAKQAADKAQKAQQAQQQAQQQAAKAKQEAENTKPASAQEIAKAKQAAQQAQQMAQQAKQAAQQAQREAKQAAQQAQQAQNSQKNEQENARKMKQTADKAEALTKQAQQLAKMLENKQSQQNASLKKPAAKQEETKDAVKDAAEDLQRAARHEERVGDKEQAESLNQMGEKAEAVASNEMQKAQDTMQDQQSSAREAKQAAQKAENAIKEAAKQSQQAMPKNQEAQQSSEPSEASEAQQEASQMMARALDKLDAAKSATEQAQAAENKSQQAQQAAQQAQEAMKQAQQAQAQQQQAAQAAKAQQAMQDAQQAQAEAQQAAQQAQAQQQQAQQAMKQAQQQQAQQMARQRAQNPSSSEPQATDGQVEFKEEKELVVDEREKTKEEDWTKLPKHLARELKSSKREAVPEQYRTMVNTYFEIIAERSRKKAE